MLTDCCLYSKIDCVNRLSYITVIIYWRNLPNSLPLERSCDKSVNCTTPFRLSHNDHSPAFQPMAGAQIVCFSYFYIISSAVKKMWDVQINKLCSKLSQKLAFYLDYGIKFQGVYNTMVEPILDYCITVWGYAPCTYIRKYKDSK